MFKAIERKLSKKRIKGVDNNLSCDNCTIN